MAIAKSFVFTTSLFKNLLFSLTFWKAALKEVGGGVRGWKVGAREKEKTQESSLCESPRCSLVHCAVCCQVKLGSTGSVSVKKSILDGRLLPGKSVLIPGLILDQRLRWNDMPLGPKMNTFGSGNWMEMCQVIAPRLLVLLSWRAREEGSAREGESTALEEGVVAKSLGSAGPSESIFRPSPRPSGVFSGHCCPAPANALCARWNAFVHWLRLSWCVPQSARWRIAHLKIKQGPLFFVSVVRMKERENAILMRVMCLSSLVAYLLHLSTRNEKTRRCSLR